MNKEMNFQVMLDSLVDRKYRVESMPVQLMFGLTNVCNLHCAFCPYCGFCSAKIEMVQMIPLELLENLKPYLSSAQFINPSGRGEPFLYKNFDDFIKICRECDALGSMQLTNNGTQLGRYDLTKLEGVNIIAVSVDSVDKKTFEILRFGAKLEQVLENVEKLRKSLPNTVIQWCVVVNRLNISQLVDIYSKARELGINYITFNDVYGYEDDKVIQLLRLRESDKVIVNEQFDEIERLNADGKLVVNNVISWSGFEDESELDREAIFGKLEELKKIEPYLDFDKLNCVDDGTRRIKVENRKKLDDTKIRLPYCTNPFEVMFIQPDGEGVAPCCASYGVIDKIYDNDVEAAWNGQNLQLLREAMFNYDMLPDYCRQCEAFMRYDYINEYWERCRTNAGEISREDVVIPPNFLPPAELIRNKELSDILGVAECVEEETKVDRDLKRKNNIEKFIKNMVDQKMVLDNNPTQIQIGLTNICNLNCAFCLYCGFCMKKIQKGEMLELEAIRKIEEFLRTADIVIPSGRGEPLLYKNFSEFMEICKNTGAIEKMQLINNGTMLDRYDPEMFEGVNIISISFDSVTKEVFELLRYGSDYEKIVNNIRKLRHDLPDAVLQLSVTVNRMNMEELAGIYQLAREIGINYISYNSLYGAEEDEVFRLLRLRASDRAIVDRQFDVIHRLNEDNQISIIDVVTWNTFDDHVEYNRDEIFLKLQEMKSITPYLDYDELEMYEQETRTVHEECRTVNKEKRPALPYCTNPFCVMLMQPNQDVSPCCASFGAISNMQGKNTDEVWNSKEYQLMREAMFDYAMLPDYCKKCRSFIRYDYINQYIDELKHQNKMDYNELIIPPDFYPPEGLVQDKRVVERIEMAHRGLLKDGIGKRYLLNSKEYWNNRFEKDWKLYNGNEQTRFFAKKINELIPEWLVHEVNENHYTVCDLGCAQGDALKIYKETFMTSDICGEDFSEVAITYAKENYPEFSFEVSDILAPSKEEKYPVIICSNVVEQFKETYKVIENICQRAEEYAIILIPYREEEGAIFEHERVFHTKDIPMRVGDNFLVYAKTVECNSVYYPYEQMLLVYAKNKKYYLLSNLIENVSSDREQTLKNLLDGQIAERDNQIAERDGQIRERDARLEEQIRIAEKEMRDTIADYQKQIEALSAENVRCVNDISATYEEQIRALRGEANRINQEFSNVMALLNQKDEYILQTEALCNHFATGKLMQLNHLLFRIKGQLLRGNREERKAFWSWIGGRIHKTNRSIGAGAVYNPWMVLNGKLQEALNCKYRTVSSDLTQIEPNNSGEYRLSAETRRILGQKYDAYDVIMLSVIDYNFRYQRPQHFADRFAANGHRVFYVNANFIRPDTVVEEKDNLYVVDFACNEYNTIYAMDGKASLGWMKEKFASLIEFYAIRDAVIVVDYPNWVYGAEYIREKFGFKIITDYMDDYTGFLGTAEDFLKENCIKLLNISDAVAASSQFLYDVAERYTDSEKIGIIRNGTEVEHFYQAYNREHRAKERKVIGYYGAVAHWFASEKVCHLAKAFTDCDIVIVGEVSEHREQLEKYENIKLLGEKPYKKLPQYLADFDVCLIPFDTSTDLIKATNPVKFYEYLSAGKKVVATEIPELMPFRDEFVYMSNDDVQFEEYVRMCLDGTDTLKTADECVAFARDNDWQSRFEKFAELCVSQVPKVSVVVLTYNNKKMNKDCIESILDKTAYANYELIIVDNHSTDDTVEYLKELQESQHTNVKIIFNEENLGFAGGNNCGMQAASGDYVILLNNDTVVTRGWMTSLVKHLENDKEYAMCNPVTNSIGNESKIVAKYNDKVSLQEFAYGYTAAHMGEEFMEVDRLPLFSTIIRKKVIDEVGMLDDEYKIGMFEDDDFTERVLHAGYGIVIAEDAFVHHINNGSFKKLDDKEYKEVFEANKKRFEQKWDKKWCMPKYRDGVDWDSNKGVSI